MTTLSGSLLGTRKYCLRVWAKSCSNSMGSLLLESCGTTLTLTIAVIESAAFRVSRQPSVSAGARSAEATLARWDGVAEHAAKTRSAAGASAEQRRCTRPRETETANRLLESEICPYA